MGKKYIVKRFGWLVEKIYDVSNWYKTGTVYLTTPVYSFVDHIRFWVGLVPKDKVPVYC